LKKLLVCTLALWALLFFMPLTAVACMGPLSTPTAICRDTDSNSSLYFRVNDRYFKIAPSLVPLGQENAGYTRAPRPKYEYERGQSMSIHVLWDTLEPVCNFVQSHNDEMSVDNLYSLYHHPIPRWNTCTGRVKMGPYIPDFVTRPSVITLQGAFDPYQGKKSLLEQFQTAANRRLQYYQPRPNMPAEVKKLTNIRGYEGFAKDHSEHSHDIFPFWEHEKQLLFIRKPSAQASPALLECFHHRTTDRILNEPNSLSEYEMCELSFVLEEKDLFATIRLHGSQIQYLHKSPLGERLFLEPIIQKAVAFIEQFSIPSDDPALLEHIRKIQAENDQDILAGKFGDPLAMSAFRAREDLVKKLLLEGADPNGENKPEEFGKAYEHPLRYLFLKDYWYLLQDPKLKLNVTKLLLEAGASIKQADINDNCRTENTRCANFGYDPILCHALKRNGPDMISLLLEYGADAKAITSGGKSMFHCAISSTQDLSPDVLTLLKNAGADPLARDYKEKTPRDYMDQEDQKVFDTWLQEQVDH
jgi:hypothetical protein